MFTKIIYQFSDNRKKINSKETNIPNQVLVEQIVDWTQNVCNHVKKEEKTRKRIEQILTVIKERFDYVSLNTTFSNLLHHFLSKSMMIE